MEDKYKMFKQFMHNELGITKDDIRQWVKEAVQDEARRMVTEQHRTFDLHETCKKITLQSGLINNQFNLEVRQEVARIIANQLIIDIKK